jgi:hypothetical protein
LQEEKEQYHLCLAYGWLCPCCTSGSRQLHLHAFPQRLAGRKQAWLFDACGLAGGQRKYWSACYVCLLMICLLCEGTGELGWDIPACSYALFQ